MSLTIKDEQTKQGALDVLTGMAEVARNDMIARAGYLSNEVVNHDLAERGAICGGHQACAVGSLWLGAGIKPRKDRSGGYDLPGVLTAGSTRTRFLNRRPALKLAYSALNEAADRYCKQNDIDLESDRYSILSNLDGTMERLFEARIRRSKTGRVLESYKPLFDAKDMPKIIKSAKAAIRRAA